VNAYVELKYSPHAKQRQRSEPKGIFGSLGLGKLMGGAFASVTLGCASLEIGVYLVLEAAGSAFRKLYGLG
jgi:hypothetical protein